MALICLKCGHRVPDDHIEPCPGDEQFDCGAREWAWVDTPKGELRLSRNDLKFLHQIHISKD